MKNSIKVAAIAISATLTVASALAEGTGADLYKAKCAMCHAADGSGNTPAGKSTKAKPLTLPEIVKKSDADLIAITKSGKGKMPAYAKKLTDPQIKDVVTYIRTLQK